MIQLDVDPELLRQTDEQRQLRDVLREFLAQTCGPEEVREQSAGPRGFDRSLWDRLAGEIGVHGLALPEEYGGAGGSFRELAVALEETGRVLCPAPLLSSVVLAAHALLASGDRRACERWLPGIATGTLTATVAGFLHSGTVVAERGPDGWLLRGEADFVPDGEGADLLLVAARAPDGPRLFACESDAGGVDRTPRRLLDPTRRQALLRFRGAPAVPVGDAGEAPGVVEGVLDAGRTGLTAEQLGGCAHALDALLEFVVQRTQFGRQIGSFQAVKHRLADLLVEVEAARSASTYAALCLADPDAGEPRVAAGAAAVVCSAAYRRAVAEYVQFHGGIGFTWEHPAHLYVRRARADEALFGTSDDHRLRLAGFLGLVGDRSQVVDRAASHPEH
ncbi:acyl-CoA dehydrogenase family protein [Streptomyces lanatus]|uniref:Acyl-CoA dehydrogenase family protein n=1 Tax=Streptomyces lanatus TaxID=66900 RepID=A0ABV1Y2A7_9ACTN|nr:acyl-CoA dehydrogenase family protein [Streptomyces lanatus]GHH25408.1 acyl-CoA dehydrogenase [Streptomyces lanatus]